MVPPRQGRGVRDRPHGDRFREGRGEASREDDRDVARRHGDAEDHAEHIHQSVLTSEDEIGEEAGLRVLLRQCGLVDLPPECETGRHRRCRPNEPLRFDRCAPVTNRPTDGIRIHPFAAEGFSKHPRIRATDDGSERISARGTRVRRPAFEVGSRHGGGLGCGPREGPAPGGRAHRGPRDRTAFAAILAALGKEWVDLEALASGGRPLDQEGRTKVRDIAAARDPSSSIAATLALLRDGYAAVSIAEGLAVEAAKRVVAAKGYDLDSARAFMFTHAAGFVLRLSRTSERLYALFQAAVRVRSPEPSILATSTSDAPGEGEDLCPLAGEFDARKPMEAGVRTRAYLSRGYSPARLLDVLANYACRDSAASNDGISLIFADTCAAEFLASKAPEIPMALAKMIAASPKDPAAYNRWAPHLAA